jgi:hypothetical protein
MKDDDAKKSRRERYQGLYDSGRVSVGYLRSLLDLGPTGYLHHSLAGGRRLTPPTRIYKAVLFDGPFHGQVHDRDELFPALDIVLIEPPKIGLKPAEFTDLLYPEGRRHRYVMRRRFPEMKAVLYYYKGLTV